MVKTMTDFRDAMIQQEVDSNGWMVWPPIPYSSDTVIRDPDMLPAIGKQPSPDLYLDDLGTGVVAIFY
jgi:microcin C transport system permease protein